jgi:hypothetical protein
MVMQTRLLKYVLLTTCVVIGAVLTGIPVAAGRGPALPWAMPPAESDPPPAEAEPRYYESLLEIAPSRLAMPARQALDPDEIITNPQLDMRVLVLLSANVAEGVNLMVLGYLDILGIPYEIIDTSKRIGETALFDAATLATANHGHYYAVFITSSTVWGLRTGENPDGLLAAEREVLDAYERSFNVRRVIWYAYPNATDYGLDNVPMDTTPYLTNTASVTATLTVTGTEVFAYLWPTATVEITGSWKYLATPAPGADVTPLLETVGDSPPYVLMAIFRPGDGREHLVFTSGSYYMDPPGVSNFNLHARILPYGVINWATRGLFLGERHLYFAPQPDDIFSWGDRWDAETHQYVYDPPYTMTVSDMENLVTWLHWMTSTMPNAADFHIELPFNGEGADAEMENGLPKPGTFTAKAVEHQAKFVWLNHTYTHADLNEADAITATYEISENNHLAVRLGLTDYTTRTLLTGAYSGLTNTTVVSTAFDLGVRYMLADASRPGYDNPSPNTGIPYPGQPELLLVPRNACNIFYAPTNPEEETDLYNVWYCSGYPTTHTTPCWDYAGVLDRVASQALGFLLDFSVNATMFHMNNLDDYGEGRTLMGDMVEALYGKYNAFYRDDIPVLSLTTEEIGEKMWERMAYDDAGVSGVLGCGNWVTLSITATDTTVVPLTGLAYGPITETYARQQISYITMAPGVTLTITGSAPEVPDQVSGLSISSIEGGFVLIWDGGTDVLAYRVYKGATPTFELDPTALVATTELTTYTHSDPTPGYYAVTAIGDNCWKQESAPARQQATAVQIVRIQAMVSSASMLVVVVLVVVLFAVCSRQRRRG